MSATDPRLARLRAAVEQLPRSERCLGYQDACDEVLALLDGEAEPEPHTVPCAICGKPSCTVEDCPEQGHDDSSELSALHGWVCSFECRDRAARLIESHAPPPSDARERLAVAIGEAIEDGLGMRSCALADAILAATCDELEPIAENLKATAINATDALQQVAALTARVEAIRRSQCADADLDHEMDERVTHLTARVEEIEQRAEMHARADRLWNETQDRRLTALENVVAQMGPPFIERAAPSGDAPCCAECGGTVAGVGPLGASGKCAECCAAVDKEGSRLPHTETGEQAPATAVQPAPLDVQRAYMAHPVAESSKGATQTPFADEAHRQAYEAGIVGWPHGDAAQDHGSTDGGSERRSAPEQAKPGDSSSVRPAPVSATWPSEIIEKRVASLVHAARAAGPFNVAPPTFNANVAEHKRQLRAVLLVMRREDVLAFVEYWKQTPAPSMAGPKGWVSDMERVAERFLQQQEGT